MATFVFDRQNQRTQADLNRAWMVVETTLKDMLRLLDKVRGSAVDREWRSRLKDSLSTVSAHRRLQTDLSSSQVQGSYNNAIRMIQVVGEWDTRLRGSLFATPTSFPAVTGAQLPGSPSSWTADPSTGGARIDPSQASRPSAYPYGTSAGRGPTDVSIDEPLSFDTPPTVESGESFFNPNQLWALIDKVAGGYSGYEKSKLHGQLMAQQMTGKPLQVDPLVAQQAKDEAARKFPWGWILVGAVIVGGVVLLAARPKKRGDITVMPPVRKFSSVPAMKALPAPV